MLVASVGIAHAHRLAGSDAIGETVALVHIEHGILSQHRDQAGVSFVPISILHLQLLDEVDPRSVLTLAHMPAGFLRLLERQKPWCCPAAVSREPKQDELAP